MGPRRRDRLMFTQYSWTDGTKILNSSTAQLRLLQVQARIKRHGALSMWMAQLGRPIPEDFWQVTWINYRSAAENTFLWQLIYRIPATNKWRLCAQPANDQETWCVRCQLQAPEDIFHCIWDCPTWKEWWT